MSLLKIEFSELSKAYEKIGFEEQRRSSSIKKTIDETTQKIRNLNSALSPAMLRNVGLMPAIKWLLKSFEEKTRIRVISSYPDYDLNFAYQNNLCIYRIVQEFLTNTAKHSNASELKFSLSELSGMHFELVVEDDGRGFEVKELSNQQHGLGMSGMKRRAESMGATFELQSFPKGGTRIRMQWAKGDVTNV